MGLQRLLAAVARRLCEDGVAVAVRSSSSTASVLDVTFVLVNCYADSIAF